jgi:deazaflavin-dependent oxidoreductase (nitroreductase family)
VAQTANASRTRQSSAANTVERLFTDLQVFLYRLSGGSIGGTFKGAPVLLLTVTGRKTGKKRTKPLLYLEESDQIALVASHGGAPTDPVWWRNLQHNPRAEVQIGRNVLQVEAREATAEEREHFWPCLVAMYPDYEDYQKRTSRTIPVVILQKIR